MDIPHLPFGEWRTRHLYELQREYRQYLTDTLDDAGFDITHVEDFDSWVQEEYELLHGYAEE